jgi:hypothetical protein
MVILCTILACFFGYRAFFFSDDWFRAKEARRADWWDNHPRLRKTMDVLGYLIVVLLILNLIRRTYLK